MVASRAMGQLPRGFFENARLFLRMCVILKIFQRI
jgi:hypothetical protein